MIDSGRASRASVAENTKAIAPNSHHRARRSAWVAHHGRTTTGCLHPGLRSVVVAITRQSRTRRRQLQDLRHEAATTALAARLMRVVLGEQDNSLETDIAVEAEAQGDAPASLREALMDRAAFASGPDDLKQQAHDADAKLAEEMEQLERTAAALAAAILLLAGLAGLHLPPQAPFVGAPSPRSAGPPGRARRRRRARVTLTCRRPSSKEDGHVGRLRASCRRRARLAGAAA